MMNIKKISAALIIATMTAGVPVAMAQSMDNAAQQQYGTAQGAAQAAAAPVSDTDLEKFVDAENKVNDIRTELTEELSSADDQQEAQQMQMGAQKEMVEAIEDADLEIPRYNEIASRLQTDMELRQRAQQIN